MNSLTACVMCIGNIFPSAQKQLTTWALLELVSVQGAEQTVLFKQCLHVELPHKAPVTYPLSVQSTASHLHRYSYMDAADFMQSTEVMYAINVMEVHHVCHGRYVSYEGLVAVRTTLVMETTKVM